MSPSAHRLPRWSVFLVQQSILVAANLAAVGLTSVLIPLIREPSDVELFMSIYQEYGPILMLLSFALPILISLVYDLPILASKAEACRPQAPTRVLSGPLVVSLLSLLGWLINALGTFGIAAQRGIDLGFHFGSRLAMENLINGIFCFVISYYAIEWYHRRWVIPRYLPSGELSAHAGRLRIGVRGRFLVHFVASGLFPLMLMFFAAYTLATRLEQDASYFRMLWVLYLGFALLGLGLTWFFAQGYRTTLSRLRRMTASIGQGDFGHKVLVDTADELGNLAEAVNRMNQGLAERERLHEAFGKAVDPRVRDAILERGDDLGGETREAAILFCDIRGFTALSESMEPAQVVALLNRYFARMAACIQAEGGVVNKFIGDAVLAVFGVPQAIEAPAQAAARAALAMRRARRELNQELAAEGSRIQLQAGVGIHLGPVLAGSIGSPERMEYTVIGDTVNVASRVEKLCKAAGVDLLLTSQAAQALGSRFPLRKLGRSKVAGKAEALLVYTIDAAD